MPDHRLTPLTALGNDAPRNDTIGGMRIAEFPDVALASVACRRGKTKALAKLAKSLLGGPLPDVAAHTAGKDVGAFWTGPEQWMFEASFAAHESLAQELKTAFGDSASITEQTDAWVRFDIEGASVASLFERLCNLDVRAMATDSASRTAIEHIGCFVICRAAGSIFSVLGPRSSAGSLHHALITAAKASARSPEPVSGKHDA